MSQLSFQVEIHERQRDVMRSYWKAESSRSEHETNLELNRANGLKSSEDGAVMLRTSCESILRSAESAQEEARSELQKIDMFLSSTRAKASVTSGEKATTLKSKLAHAADMAQSEATELSELVVILLVLRKDKARARRKFFVFATLFMISLSCFVVIATAGSWYSAYAKEQSDLSTQVVFQRTAVVATDIAQMTATQQDIFKRATVAVVQATVQKQKSIEQSTAIAFQATAQMATQRVPRIVAEHPLSCIQCALSVVWSPDSVRLASSGGNKNIAIYNILTRQTERNLIGHADTITSIMWSLDGKWLASGSADRTIIIWNVESGQPEQTLKGHVAFVTSIAWSPDGKKLISGGNDKRIIVWNIETGQNEKTLTTFSPVNTVGWSPDSKYVASGSQDGSITIWEIANGKAYYSMKATSPVQSVMWSPSGDRLALGLGSNAVWIWSLAEGRTIISWTAKHTDTVWSVAWSPDGQRLASASGDKTIVIWDVSRLEASRVLTGHTGLVYSVAWSPDSKWVASASEDNSVRIWNVEP
ncbi:MAG: WD40 repeat domain-containing protein [Chloroflexi bacterium]|nr:WD40 repeat domain-containing protein [Chloroflexota bacterium]